MGLLWSVINSMQIIVHLPLMNLDLPANVIYLLQALVNVVTFDLMKTEKFHQKLYNLGDMEKDYTEKRYKFY